MQRVLIIYRTLPQYRVEFYNQLKAELKKHNIDLQLIYGNTNFDSRKDSAHIDWAIFRKNKVLPLGRFSLIWQPCLNEINKADLVIVEQANKLLVNYIIILRKLLINKKFAFWGHGLNLQASKTSLFNLIKKVYSNQTTWWFAYTKGVQNTLVKNGFDKDRITIVQNAIDTKKLRHYYDSFSEEDVTSLKNKLEISSGEKVLIYCGALYKEKRLEFLIRAVEILVAKQYKVKLIVLGSGPKEEFIKQNALEKSWLIYEGPKFSKEKALYFRLADIFLHPGAMGLAVLDSFAFETPIVTTHYKYHGPEIDYIINSYNGIVTNNNLDEYSKSLAELLNNINELEDLKKNCKSMLDMYNVETMVINFSNGIRTALNQ